MRQDEKVAIPADAPRRHPRQQPDPVRPGPGAYARASDQGLAALDGLVLRPERPAPHRAGSSQARCSSTPATSTSRASPFSALASMLRTPAYDVQQACGTGLEAAILVANKIALGQIDSAHRGRGGHDERRTHRRE